MNLNDDDLDPIDMNEVLGVNTLYIRVTGECLYELGISNNDWVVVDREQPVANGDVVAVYLNGQITLKRYQKEGTNGHCKISLVPANPNFSPISVKPADEVVLIGKVTYTIHKQQ